MAADQHPGPVDPEQQQLIDACRAGDRRAQERLFRQEAPHLRRLTAALVGPGGLDIDDVLQATFLAAIRGFQRFRGEASVRTWLTKIAVRTAHDQLRSAAARRAVLSGLTPSMPETPDTGPGIDSRLDDRVRLERLYAILDRIEPRKRMAFVLHVVHGYSVEDVATLTETYGVLAKARIARARRTLLKHAAKDPWLKDWVKPSGALAPGGSKDRR